MSAGGWRSFDPEHMDATAVYHLLNALVIPRPIAWVSTISAEGVPNLAPHSYFTAVSSRPPMVCFSSGGEKDTLRNLRHSGDFVVNVVPEELAHEMNLTSADFPPGESEFAASGLTPTPSARVRAPRLLESPASLECVVEREVEVGDVPNIVVFGRVVAMHVAERVMEDGRVEVSKIRPVGRLSGSGYSWTREFFRMERPTYAGLKAEWESQKGTPGA
jgi:flavin reductase (DIM6/NTAB) family NADH-FMN oxidoreductase RutF